MILSESVISFSSISFFFKMCALRCFHPKRGLLPLKKLQNLSQIVHTSFDNLKNWVSRAFYNSDAGITETSRRHNVATLGRSLTLIVVDQTSRRCNVTTLEHRDFGTSRRCCLVFTSSSSHFQKSSKNHHIHLQCTQDPKIRYRVIMYLLIYKIELKRSKDADMT